MSAASKQPTYLKIFEAVGDYSAIGRGTMLDCQIMLEAGWKVTVVSKFLDEDLKKHVDWRPLTVPKRGFALQWLSARHFLLQARGTDAFDCVHAHQPQISDSCDVFQCHFLTRAASNRHCLAPWRGKRAATRLQEEIVLRAEDRFYNRLARLKGPQAPCVLFISELLQREFEKLYGTPQSGEVLVKAPPQAIFPTDAERQSARQKWASEAGNRLVVGFLGGTHERKGFRRVLKALEGENDLFLLFGGPNSENFEAPQLQGRFKSVGFVREVREFFAACDVLLVASHFEPLGMVALEAAASGLPVVATEGVGAWATLEKFRAGLLWQEGKPLTPLVRDLVSRRGEVLEGARRLCEVSGAEAYGRRLVEVCEMVRDGKSVQV